MTQFKDDAIKNCPFCGSIAIYNPVGGPSGGHGEGNAGAIVCRGCKIKATYSYGGRDLIEKWNTRKTQEIKK